MSFRILFVDDDPESLALFKFLVEPLGCSVVTMPDSRRAAQIIEDQKFDGICVDVEMPDIDGFELSRRIRASVLNRTTPIFMLTGSDDSKTRQRGFEAGVTFFLGKPFDRGRLCRLIRAASGAMLREKCR